MPRLGLFVDAANMFYAQRKQGWSIDYFRALTWLLEDHEEGCAYYFTGTPAGNSSSAVKKQRGFHRALAHGGYTVIHKEAKRQYDKERDEVRYKCNLDVEITLKMLAEVSQYDDVVFFGGDGDFAPVLEHLRNLGKRVRVISYEPFTSDDIINAAHTFTPLDEVRRELERQQTRKKN